MYCKSSMQAALGVVLRLLAVAPVFTAIGCDVPAQIVWSPDGSHAAYRSGEHAFLLNQKGTILQPLGSSVGGFVWSADSKSLYFAASDEDHHVPTPPHLEWIGPPSDPSTQPDTPPTTLPATEPAEPKTVTVVSVLSQGKTTPLFRLADVVLWNLQMSSDERWIAAIASVNKQDDNSQEFQLFVYSIQGGGLYELSHFCGLGACFTGPDELAFVEASGVDAVGQIAGHLVKVKLDEAASTLPRQRLLDAIIPLTKWMEPCKGGLMFAAAPRAFPAPPTSDSAREVYKLFHYSCADGGLSVLADDVGELFDASPDGKRILFEKLTYPEVSATGPTTQQASTKADPIRDELCVMNANGSDPHVLRSLDEYVGDPKPPMWPAWRGNDQITFIAPADRAGQIKVDAHDRKAVDVIQYHLTDTGTLEKLQTLSASWSAEMKPYFHTDNPK